MALTVGGVAIDLSANASQVVSEMEKAARATLNASQKMQGGLSGWSNSFKRVETGVTGFASRVGRALGGIGRALPSLLGVGGLAGGAGIAGIGLMAKQSLEAASAIVDAADKAGIGTEAYQSLAFQAAQVDLSVEQLNTGLTTFATRVGQAQAGTGALSSTMNKLNPALAIALRSTHSQEAALRIVSDAMAGARSQTEKLALEQAAFGRGAGGAFVLAIGSGSKAMDEQTAKARSMGVVLEDNLLRGAEAAGDQLDILAQVINARLTGAIVQVAPQIAEMATSFANAIPQIAEYAKAVIDVIPAVQTFAQDSIAVLRWWFSEELDIFENSKREWESIKKAWESLSSFVTGTAPSVGGVAAEHAGMLGEGVPPGSGLSRIPTIPPPASPTQAPPPAPTVPPPEILKALPSAAATRNTEAATAAVERLNETIEQSRQIAQTAGFDRLLPQIGAEKPIRDAVIQLGEMRSRTDDVFRSELALQEGTAQLAELFKVLSAAVREAGGGSEEIEKLRGQILAMQGDLEATAAAAELVAAPAGKEMFGPPKPDPGVLHEEQRGLEINRQLERSQVLYDQLNSAASTFASTVSSGFTSAIMGAKSFGEAMQGIINSLVEAAIQAAIFQAVTMAIGTAGPGGTGALGALFPGAAGAARAAGGPVRPGMAYQVGERGREYFVPSVGGNILTQAQMAGAGGGRGGGDVYNIYADRIDPGTAARLVNTARAGAPAATVNAMSRGLVRNERRPPF